MLGTKEKGKGKCKGVPLVGEHSVSPCKKTSCRRKEDMKCEKECYELASLTVTDKDGNKVALTDEGDGKYTFEMPRRKVRPPAPRPRPCSCGICNCDRKVVTTFLKRSVKACVKFV